MDDTAIVTFTPALVVRAGSTETLDLIVELAEDPDGSGPLTGATVGAEHDFAITEVTGVSAQGLPVRTALMRIGSYAVPAVTIDAVRTDTTYNVGQENALIANFRVENSGERNNIFKSITLRNNGTADIAGSLSKVRVLNDGREISSRVEIV
jgi:hypothetical protein